MERHVKPASNTTARAVGRTSATAACSVCSQSEHAGNVWCASRKRGNMRVGAHVRRRGVQRLGQGVEGAY